MKGNVLIHQQVTPGETLEFRGIDADRPFARSCAPLGMLTRCSTIFTPRNSARVIGKAWLVIEEQWL